MQAHLFYSGGRISMSAENREIVEQELIDEYHWTPEQIEKMSYKRLKKILLIRQQKNATHQNQQNISDFKQKSNQMMSSRGQSKKFYREV